MSTFINTSTYNESGDKRFSEACERNKAPILNALRPLLAGAKTVLEIGSGSGQHAVYFGQHMPHLTWQTSDIPINHPSIRAWIAEANLTNVKPPISLNVDDVPWSLRDAGLNVKQVDAIYSSNTLHIISWPQVIKFFEGIAPLLRADAHLLIYGPFKYGGQFTSEGDANFDQHLRQQNEGSGIRDVEEIHKLANGIGLTHMGDVQLPANNHLLIWQNK